MAGTQEAMGWLAEAAQAPAIRATQVLDPLVTSGTPSCGEMIDTPLEHGTDRRHKTPIAADTAMGTRRRNIESPRVRRSVTPRSRDSPKVGVPAVPPSGSARVDRHPGERLMNKQLMAIALATTALMAAPVRATSVGLVADGKWMEFNVDSDLAADSGSGWIDEDYAGDDSTLNFTFTIAKGSVGKLTVVDAGFAGDTFSVTSFGNAIGATSGVPVGTRAGSTEFSFDAALADPAYSNGVFMLGAGAYSVSGSLLQSVDGNLDATNGALRLTTSAVPEPSRTALMFGGLAAVAVLARRRKSSRSI
jgi:hypothetical protein